jgi:hypothetical protein
VIDAIGFVQIYDLKSLYLPPFLRIIDPIRGQLSKTAPISCGYERMYLLEPTIYTKDIGYPLSGGTFGI